MRTRNSEQSRPAIIIGSLLYLMSAHRRTPCPYLAQCVARHLECLTCHPEVDCVIRQTCDAVRKEWELAAGIAPPTIPRSARTREFPPAAARAACGLDLDSRNHRQSKRSSEI